MFYVGTDNLWFFCFFFFKQKTAYEMRISDWSSDVCSSDLGVRFRPPPPPGLAGEVALVAEPTKPLGCRLRGAGFDSVRLHHSADRKSVVSGKSVSVRVDLGGRRIFIKNNAPPL